MNTNLHKDAYYRIVDKTEEVMLQYFSRRPKVGEMADWGKEDLREFLLDIIDTVERTDYELTEMLDAH